MISVVSAQEARDAVQAGALLLDAKNPLEGSLGAQFPGVIRAIRDVARGNIQISAAIGDMPNLPGTAALAALGAAVCGADYVKVGLHGQRSEEEAIALVHAVRVAVGSYKTKVIAAGYADYQRLGLLDPRCLPRVAKEAEAHGCLIDTDLKNGQTLFDFIAPEKLSSLVAEAHGANMLFGAAGALREEDLPLLRSMEIDVVGLRTAVCRGSQRNGELDPLRVNYLINKFSGQKAEPQMAHISHNL